MLIFIVKGIIRSFRRNRLDFFINLIGLSVAMVVFIAISLYVRNELSFDKYHPDANKIFRLTTSITSPNGQQTNMALANTAFAYSLKETCPEIEDIVCVNIGGDDQIKYNNAEFKNINIRSATPSIFNFFEYSIVEGASSEFLRSPNTIILTETLAKTIFKDKSPIGEILLINDNNYTVNGVIEDLPNNTDLQFSALKYSNINGSEDLVDWGEYFVYCKVNTEVNGLLMKKINKITDEKYTEELQKMGGFKLEHNLQALTTIHFNTSLLADTPKGNKKMIYLFSVVAILILIIAGINYINLNTAQLHKKEKDLSIRKIMGCGRKWIVVHVLSESVINFLVAILVSFSMTLMLIPLMNYLFNKQFDHSSIYNQLFSLSTIFLASGLLAGVYPAYKINKSDISKKTGFGRLGKVLIIFQNGISILMIAGVLLIGKQVNYMKKHDLGLGINKNQIIAINLPFSQENYPGTEVIRQEFSSLSGIKSLAFGGGGTNLGTTDYWMKAIMVTKDEEGNDVQFVVNQPEIDENYIDLFDIKLIEGRNFDPTISTDKKWGVIVNKTYVNTMGWKNPIGKSVFDDTKHKVIGVVEDFHFDALYNPIEPLLFAMMDGLPNYLFASVNPQNLKAIQNHWEKTFNDIPFEYEFIDQRFAQLYKKNEKEMSIFFYLTMVAILISCLGLYGLASHFILKSTKEIGIRKVNGAKTHEIMAMLNKDFLKWVTTAFVIACPIAWYAMHKWLENFAYKTELSWWIFALAGCIALGIALLTVSFQSWRAATRNPVESLRYE